MKRDELNKMTKDGAMRISETAKRLSRELNHLAEVVELNSDKELPSTLVYTIESQIAMSFAQISEEIGRYRLISELFFHGEETNG